MGVLGLAPPTPAADTEEDPFPDPIPDGPAWGGGSWFEEDPFPDPTPDVPACGGGSWLEPTDGTGRWLASCSRYLCWSAK